MVEFSERFGDIMGHGNIHISSSVVPFQGKAKVARTSPILGESIAVTKSRKEMIGVSLGEVFDTKIVHSKSERGAASGMVPETRGEAHGRVAIGGEMVFQLVVGKDAGLF